MDNKIEENEIVCIEYFDDDAEEFNLSDIPAEESNNQDKKIEEKNEKNDVINKIKKILSFKTITSKIALSLIICCLLMTFAILKLYSNSAMKLESDLIGSRLQADIIHLEDIIVKGSDYSEWHIEDGYLYCGNVCLGNGTEETANLDPFYETEEKTGTFCYTFMRTGDEGLTWHGDQETGYMEGHYIRIAGSTKDPNGNSIVGTYIDKKIADAIDANGTYQGEANVVGGMIYCVYNCLYNDNGETVGAIVVGRSMTELKNQVHEAEKRISYTILLVILLMGLALLMTTTKWSKAITKIVAYLERIQEGELPEDKLTVKASDEIYEMVVSVNKMVEGLKDKERIGAELNVATDIQVSMLPKIFPQKPNEEGFDIFATMHPAKEVGGDLYDFFKIDDTHMAIVIADVSGKGVPAALFMAIAKAVIKNSTQVGMEPADVFEAANDILCDGNEQGFFVTALMGIIDLKTGIMQLVNAGHTPPLIGRDGKYEFKNLKPCLTLAVMENMKYVQTEIQMKPGDRILFYTDGVTEATNSSDELYDNDRLKDYMNANADKSIIDIVNGLNEDVMNFTGDAPQFDDITILMFDFIKNL